MLIVSKPPLIIGATKKVLESPLNDHFQDSWEYGKKMPPWMTAALGELMKLLKAELTSKQFEADVVFPDVVPEVVEEDWQDVAGIEVSCACAKASTR